MLSKHFTNALRLKTYLSNRWRLCSKYWSIACEHTILSLYRCRSAGDLFIVLKIHTYTMYVPIRFYDIAPLWGSRWINGFGLVDVWLWSQMERKTNNYKFNPLPSIDCYSSPLCRQQNCIILNSAVRPRKLQRKLAANRKKFMYLHCNLYSLVLLTSLFSISRK